MNIFKNFSLKKSLLIFGLTGLVTLIGGLTLGAIAFAQSGSGPQAAFDHFGGPGFGPRSFGQEGHAFRGGFGPAEFQGRHRGHRGVLGEVTEIGDNSLAILNLNQESITVNLSQETVFRIVETQSEGSLSDIEPGSRVGVRGPRPDDRTIEARAIFILPEGEVANGRVTAVEGNVITVKNRRTDTESKIVTDENTSFRVGRNEPGSIDDITPGQFIVAFGQTQENGSLAARLVGIHRRHQGPGERFRRGQVLEVSSSSFTMKTFRDEREVTVQTDTSTEYRSPSGETVSFEDIAPGKMVLVKGEPVEGQENTVKAETIGLKK